jgi:hypothetical protein
MGNTTQVLLEVTLEEKHTSFWKAALDLGLTGAFGSALYRFVARPDGGDAEIEGDEFRMLRALAADEIAPAPGIDEDAALALQKLDRRIQEAGWRPEGRGRYWWSLRYTKA